MILFKLLKASSEVENVILTMDMRKNSIRKRIGDKMYDQILDLSENQSKHIFCVIASRQKYSENIETEFTPEIQNLMQEFGFDNNSVSEGDLAQQGLLLLSRKDANRKIIQELVHTQIDHPSNSNEHNFGLIETITVLTAALVILQTEFIIHRDKKGKWSINIKKYAASEELLKSFIQKLNSFWAKREC